MLPVRLASAISSKSSIASLKAVVSLTFAFKFILSVATPRASFATRCTLYVASAIVDNKFGVILFLSSLSFIRLAICLSKVFEMSKVMVRQRVKHYIALESI